MGIEHAEVLEMVRHDFSDKEKADLGKEVAEKIKERISLDGERKSIAKDYSAAIDKLDLSVKELSNKIHDGYEMRRELCYIFFDYKNRKVVYYRKSRLDEYHSRTPVMDGGVISLVEQYSDVHDNLDLEAMSEYLYQNFKLNPTKSRGMREDEFHKQRELFEEGEPQGLEVEAGEEVATEDDAAFDGKVETEQIWQALPRDDKKLKNLLSLVMEKSPTMKVIKAFSNDEYMSAGNWAASLHLAASDDVVKVPEKPAFLG